LVGIKKRLKRLRIRSNWARAEVPQGQTVDKRRANETRANENLKIEETFSGAHASNLAASFA
jgi:hypothetical protein